MSAVKPTLALVVALALTGCAPAMPADSAIPAPTQRSTAPTEATTLSGIDRTLYSIDDATSLWVVADKKRRLNPKTYVPKPLVTLNVPHSYAPVFRRDAGKAFMTMFKAAAKDGAHFVVQSAYRSYTTQVSVYNGWVAKLGKAGADLQSARPGFSEHQLGLSVDIGSASHGCTISQCFAKTPEGKWLTKNAWQYGWILRYPNGKTDITGYKYEPWHWRYVGTDLATEMHATPNLTLEEFWGLPNAPDYRQ